MQTDSKRINDFYEEYVVKHGVSAGWSSMDKARMSYDAVSCFEAQNWSAWENVLDVGSGEGHLLEFLRRQRGFRGRYTGLEILPMFHEAAMEKYGGDSNSDFVCGEFLEYDFGDAKYDWVLSLGALAVKQERQAEYDLAFCSKMLKLARHGISVYLNDVEQMKPGRREALPSLAAHKIHEFVEMLENNFSLARIEVMHYPDANSQSTMLHLMRN